MTATRTISTSKAETAPAKAPDHRTAARIIGILILAGWFTYGPGGAITASIVAVPDILANVTAHQMAFTAGAVVMLLNSAAVVGIGVMWFPVLKRHSERVALTYFVTRILEAVLLAVGVMSLLSLIALGEAQASAGATTAASFEALSGVAIALNDLSYQIGMATLGAGSLWFCHLLYRTGLVPRWLAAFGLIGYAVFAVGMVLDMFGTGVGLLLTIPGGLFELVFAFWLIVKGFRRPATGPTAVNSAAAHGRDAR